MGKVRAQVERGKEESLEPHLQFLLGRFTLLIRRLQEAEKRAKSSEEEARILANKLATAELSRDRASQESLSTKRVRRLASQLKEKTAQMKLREKQHDERIRAIAAREDAAVKQKVSRCVYFFEVVVGLWVSTSFRRSNMLRALSGHLTRFLAAHLPCICCFWSQFSPQNKKKSGMRKRD